LFHKLAANKNEKMEEITGRLLPRLHEEGVSSTEKLQYIMNVMTTTQ